MNFVTTAAPFQFEDVTPFCLSVLRAFFNRETLLKSTFKRFTSEAVKQVTAAVINWLSVGNERDELSFPDARPRTPPTTLQPHLPKRTTQAIPAAIPQT